jgi:hypothetical protein
MSILRYDDSAGVSTPLDPLLDVLSWVKGLKSNSVCSDLLRTKHSISDRRTNKTCTISVANHASMAISLFEEGLSCPEETSFISLYYGMLNLSKCCVIASGGIQDLQGQRWHGVSYRTGGNMPRDFLNDSVELRKKGALALYYQTLTGVTWGRDRKIPMSCFYPHIAGIGHEFSSAYGIKQQLQSCNLEEKIVQGKISLQLRLDNNLVIGNRGKRSLPLSKGFRKIDSLVYQTKFQSGPDAKSKILSGVRRYLLYSFVQGGMAITVTPVSSIHLLLPEEIPILMAFFHLSNISRYNPEYIARIQDSIAWPMLLALRRHASLRFLTLFWSYINKTAYLIGS